MRKTFSLWGQSHIGAGSPERLYSLHPCRFSRLNWRKPWETWFDLLADATLRCWLGDLLMPPASTKMWFCSAMTPNCFKAKILQYNFASFSEVIQHSSDFFWVMLFELESPYCSKTQLNCSFSQRGLEVLIKLMRYELSVWISQPSQSCWNKLYALLNGEYHHSHVITKEVSKEKT